jgi:2,4-dienoyl-CoA reductase-like NADH-dependent reductase (Old Yellow Enzyme family)
MRLSCSDWADGGWDIEQSIELSKRLLAIGIDLIDCSSGGVLPHVQIPVGPGYQVPNARANPSGGRHCHRHRGNHTDPEQAEAIVRDGQADMVLLAWEILHDPYWPLHAAQALGQKPTPPV